MQSAAGKRRGVAAAAGAAPAAVCRWVMGVAAASGGVGSGHRRDERTAIKRGS